MLAFFHGQDLGLFFGLFSILPAGLALFLLHRWKTQGGSVLVRISKTVLTFLAWLLMLFGLLLLLMGLQEIIDLYL